MNDYYYFVKVVENKGFTHAAEMINSPKSKISRNVKKLEERLDMRLIQRTTRHFVVTEAGWEFYRHAKKVVSELELAENIVKNVRAPCLVKSILAAPTEYLTIYCPA